jgi:hypothetical protein
MPLTADNETLWHFVGELRVFKDIATANERLDGENQPVLIPELVPNPSQDIVIPQDPQALLGMRLPYGRVAGSQDIPQDPFEAFMRDIDAFKDAINSALRIPQDRADVLEPNGPSNGPTSIRAEYRDGGSEVLADIEQVSIMDDRDMLLDARGGLCDADQSLFDEWRGVNDAAFVALKADVEAITHGFDLPVMVASTGGILDWQKAQAQEMRLANTMTDEEREAEGPVVFNSIRSISDGDFLTVGRHLDGEAVSSDTKPQDVAEDALPISRFDLFKMRLEGTETLDDRGTTTPDDDGATAQGGTLTSTIHGPSHGIGVFAETGGNTATNAAIIVDSKEMCGSMLIGGDVFKLNAIIQINALVDCDDITLSGEIPGLAFGDGNELHNLADYITHDATKIAMGAAFSAEWKVDVFHGDFHDINLIRQINTLDDGDIISQFTSTTYSGVSSGDNSQANLVEWLAMNGEALSQIYDVIIISGNYYSTNLILQQNIMLDSDWVRMNVVTGSDGQKQIGSTGANSLSNEATIEHYGAEAYSELTDPQLALMEALKNGQIIFTGNPDWQLSGNATGQLSILYIDGDYYDANVIVQTNLIYDADMLSQVVQNPTEAALALPAGANGENDLEAGAITGANTALNIAVIRDIGTLTGSQFIGGDVYEDSLLIQANLVTNDDSIIITNPAILVPEVVAFTMESADGGPQNNNGQSGPVLVDPGHHDTIGAGMI